MAKRKPKPDIKFEWDLCLGCGVMVRCPACGMNCCSAGYGTVDGKPCTVCPLAYQFQDACLKAGTAPTRRKLIMSWSQKERDDLYAAERANRKWRRENMVPLDEILKLL